MIKSICFIKMCFEHLPWRKSSWLFWGFNDYTNSTCFREKPRTCANWDQPLLRTPSWSSKNVQKYRTFSRVLIQSFPTEFSHNTKVAQTWYTTIIQTILCKSYRFLVFFWWFCTYIRLISFFQHNHSPPFAEAPLHFFKSFKLPLSVFAFPLGV